MQTFLLTQLGQLAGRSRVSAWFLATAVGGGLAVPAFGQDSAPAYRLYPKASQQSEPAAESQPYQRNSSSVLVENYYDELFGGQEQTESTPVLQAEHSAPAADSRLPVLTAAYEVEPATSQSEQSNIIMISGKQASSDQDLPVWARNAKSAATSKQATAIPSVPTQQQPAPADLVMPQAKLQISQSGTTGTMAKQVQAGPQSANVQVEWQSPEGINVGQESLCELVVTNQGTSTAHKVSVHAQFPSTVQLIETKPALSADSTDLHWDLGELPAGESRIIQVKLIPQQRGALNASAEVQFAAAAQADFVVREPLLGVVIKGPSKVMVGDPASQSVTITNPGNGIAKNVKLEALIPEGLEHARGEHLVMDVGSLNPGESRVIRLAMVAVGGGDYDVQVVASADGGLLETSQSSLTVIAPKLMADISGPGLRYKGREATYTLKVANQGTVSTSNVRMLHKVPEGFEFLSADRGAIYDAPTRILSWFVGKLDPGKSAEIQVTLNANKIGDFTHYVRTTSEHGSVSDTQLTTRVEGASALVMEIVDLDDPVEVGNETAYEIRVTNEGSAAAQNVGVSCELPAGVKFVSGQGPTTHVADGNLVLFKPVASIPAGKTTTFRVHVVGQVDGNLRFRARMTSAASPEPLTFEELTRFYGDVQR